MKKYAKKYWLTIIGVIVGAIGGYLYYKFVGCATGTCPITSNPYGSIFYGAIMGGLLFNMLKKDTNCNLNK